MTPFFFEFVESQLVITMAAMRWEPSFHAHILLQEIIHSYTKEMLCKECFFIRPVTALLHAGVVRCSELVRLIGVRLTLTFFNKSFRIREP